MPGFALRERDVFQSYTALVSDGIRQGGRYTIEIRRSKIGDLDSIGFPARFLGRQHGHRHHREGPRSPHHKIPHQQRMAPRRPTGLSTRPLHRPRPPLHLPAKHPAGNSRLPVSRIRHHHQAKISGPPQARDRQPGNHRRTPKGHSARAPRDKPLLRDTDSRQHSRRRTLPAEPLLRDPAAPIQQQPAAVPGHRPVRERPAHLHHGAQEPLHRPDCRRRR